MILAPARVIIGRIRFPPAAIKCPASSGISGTSLDSLFIIIALTARISSASRVTNGSSETVLDGALDCALFVGTDIALITFFQSLLFHRGESNKRSLFSDQMLQHLRHCCALGRKCVLLSRLSHTFTLLLTAVVTLGQEKSILQTNFMSAVLGVFLKVRHDAP